MYLMMNNNYIMICKINNIKSCSINNNSYNNNHRRHYHKPFRYTFIIIPLCIGLLYAYFISRTFNYTQMLVFVYESVHPVYCCCEERILRYTYSVFI